MKSKKRKIYPCDMVYESLISEVDSSRGAPLGRCDKGTSTDAKGKKLYRRRVYLPYDNAYDKGGAYWGVGPPLYVEFTLDKTYVRFIRDE